MPQPCGELNPPDPKWTDATSAVWSELFPSNTPPGHVDRLALHCCCCNSYEAYHAGVTLAEYLGMTNEEYRKERQKDEERKKKEAEMKKKNDFQADFLVCFLFGSYEWQVGDRNRPTPPKPNADRHATSSCCNSASMPARCTTSLSTSTTS